MNALETVNQAREAITVRRVYGEPLQQDGVTVIPAAVVMGPAWPVMIFSSASKPLLSESHLTSVPSAAQRSTRERNRDWGENFA